MNIIPINVSENTSESSVWLQLEEEGLKVFISNEQREEPLHAGGEVDQGTIQFYYALEGNLTFRFGPHYSLTLNEGKYFFMYNPEKVMQFELTAPPSVKWVSFFISIKKLHSLFLDNAHELPFLSGDNINKKLYEEREYSPAIQVALHQLFTVKLSANSQRIFTKSKVYEVLSLHFSTKEADTEACPFLNDEENVLKIKKAKELLIKRMYDPPSLTELSREVGINEYRLKTGFKEVYGNTVYGFLLDYKLDYARHLLDTGHYQVNEVAYKIKYTNPSHFISAFKKKFGVTPKKYLMSR